MDTPKCVAGPLNDKAPTERGVAEGLQPVLDILSHLGIRPRATFMYPTMCLDRYNEIPMVLSALPPELTADGVYLGECYYHSAQHALGVANIAWTLMRPYTLSNRERAVVLLAAMYHDAGHSGGKENDHWNVAQSIAKLRNDTRAVVMSPDSDLAVTVDMACNLIQRTLFVYGIGRYPENIVSDILRDADMLYATVSINTGLIVHKLTTERLGTDPTANQLKSAYKQQVKFLTQLEFFTPEAQRLFGKNLAPSLRDLRYYTKLICKE